MTSEECDGRTFRARVGADAVCGNPMVCPGRFWSGDPEVGPAAPFTTRRPVGYLSLPCHFLRLGRGGAAGGNPRLAMALRRFAHYYFQSTWNGASEPGVRVADPEADRGQNPPPPRRPAAMMLMMQIVRTAWFSRQMPFPQLPQLPQPPSLPQRTPRREFVGTVCHCTSGSQ